jgi:hypothetical protein
MGGNPSLTLFCLFVLFLLCFLGQVSAIQVWGSVFLRYTRLASPIRYCISSHIGDNVSCFVWGWGRHFCLLSLWFLFLLFFIIIAFEKKEKCVMLLIEHDYIANVVYMSLVCLTCDIACH